MGEPDLSRAAKAPGVGLFSTNSVPLRSSSTPDTLPRPFLAAILELIIILIRGVAQFFHDHAF